MYIYMCCTSISVVHLYVMYIYRCCTSICVCCASVYVCCASVYVCCTSICVCCASVYVCVVHLYICVVHLYVLHTYSSVVTYAINFDHASLRKKHVSYEHACIHTHTRKAELSSTRMLCHEAKYVLIKKYSNMRTCKQTNTHAHICA